MRNKCFVLFLLVFLYLRPQFYNGYDMTFGRSRTQYTQKYIWNQWRTSHFDVLFYQGERSLADYVINVAYQEFKDITNLLDYVPEKKFFFIIFSNKNDYLAANLNYTLNESINTGGIVQVVNNKIPLYFSKNHEDLRKQIRKGIARNMIYQFLFGDEPGMNVRRSQSLFLPSWFIEGLVNYIAEGWDVEHDAQLRNLLQKKKRFAINHSSGEESVLMGQAFWNFLLNTYETSTISKVLTFVVVSRSYTTALLYVYGKTFKQLLIDCQSYYHALWMQSKHVPIEGQKLFSYKLKYYIYQHQLSPDGKKFIFVTDKWDKKKIWLVDLKSRRKVKIFKTGKKWLLNKDYSYPLIAWHPSSRIVAWINEEKQLRYLYLYDIEEKNLEKINIEQFQKVLSLSFSSSGSALLLTGMLDGQVDLFLYNPGSNSIKRLTNDPFDEHFARFSPDDKWICFASNMPLQKDSNTKSSFAPAYDLFLLEPHTKKLLRVTSTTDTNEIWPNWNGNEILYFFNDDRGLQNIFSAHLDSAILFIDTTINYRYFFTKKLVSRWHCPVQEWNFQSPLNLFTLRNKDRIEIHQIDLYSLKAFNQPPHDEPAISFRRNLNSAESSKVFLSQDKKWLSSDTSSINDSGRVNIYDFKFKTLEKNEITSEEVSRINQSNYRDTFIVSRIQNYDVEYSLNRITTQIAADRMGQAYLPFSPAYADVQLPGTNGFLKVVAADLLENHRIIGGVKIKPSFRENEYLLAYENYQHRWDYQLSYLYYNFFFKGEKQGVEKHQVNNFMMGTSYPFYNLLTFRSFLLFRYDNTVKLTYDDDDLLDKGRKVYWASFRSELVYDNTIQEIPNILKGWRWKVFGEYYQGLLQKKLNLITFGADYRLYLRLYKNMILAHRFAFGTSLGRTRLMYLLGGTDQNIFARFDARNPFDTTYRYEFMAFATNLRGLPINCRNGNSFFVFNNEWRFPLVNILFRRTFSSNFLNNFQFLTFFDIGSAFVGLNPFSDKNIFRNQYVVQKPFTIEIKNYRFPIVSGLGGGFRTMLWGYFIRFDIAWGWDNYRFTQPNYLFSLGTDF